MERRYQGRWNVRIIADYCWIMKREEILNESTARRAVKEASTLSENVIIGTYGLEDKCKCPENVV